MSNGRQIEGWVISRKLPTQVGNKTWGFFEDYETANKESARFDTLLEPCEAIPATLILPAERQEDAPDAGWRDMALAKIDRAMQASHSLNSGHDDQRRTAVQVVQGYLIELCACLLPAPPVGDGSSPAKRGPV